MFLPKFVNVDIFRNSFSYCFSTYSFISSCLNRLNMIYSLYKRIHVYSIYMSQPPKPIFHDLFYYRYYPNSLFNIVIYNIISSSLTTHQTQQHRLCQTYFILVLILNYPKLLFVKHCRSYRCSIKLPLQIEQYFCVTYTLESLIHFSHITLM